MKGPAGSPAVPGRTRAGRVSVGLALVGLAVAGPLPAGPIPAGQAPVGPIPVGQAPGGPAVVHPLPGGPGPGVGTPRCPLTEEDFRTAAAVLAQWAERRRRLDDVPGLVLGLACGTDRGWTRGFGLADRERGLAATDTTPFRIASITKVFTGLAVLQLRDAGRLSLDDPVADHLPWFRPANAGEMPPVRVRHLLTHTSGLPANSSATDFNRMTQPTAGEAIRAIPSQSLVFAPGSEFKYSNLGFAVLGRLVAAASGTSYRRYVRERILDPLGLTRTVAHPSPEARQAVGYHRRVPGRPRRRADFLHLAFATPAGGMATTGVDMVRFIGFLLDPGPKEVLNAGTVREMARVHHWVDTARGGSGLAWGVEKRPGVHEVYHGGGLPSQTSHLRVDLEHGLGAVVLTNAEDADPASWAEEGLALLRLALERDDGPSPERYTGVYRWQESELWVVRLGGALRLVYPQAPRPSGTVARLRPVDGHRFRIEGGGAKGETAEFIVEEETGDVPRLRLPALLYRRTGPPPR